MKGQQLFHSFLPGVTAAVLTTQPAWAGPVKVNGVQLASSPSVLTSTYGQTLIADIVTPQPLNTVGDNSPSPLPALGLAQVNVKPFSNPSIPEIVTGNSGQPIVPILQENAGRFFSLTPTANPANLPEGKPAVTNDQKQTKLGSPGQKLESSPVKIAAVGQTNLPVSASQLQTVLPTVGQGTGKAQLLKSHNCLGADKNNQNVGCLTQNPNSIEWLAQSDTPSGTETRTPTPTGAVTIPESLQQNPNPLLFPTKSEEVKLQENQPITLSEALEAAKRNNRELQVSILELERSQAALREAQAALLPTLSVNGEVANSRSVDETRQFDIARKTNPNVGDAPSRTRFTGQAQLTYNVYTSGRRQANIKAAEEQVRINELAVESKSEEIRLNVSKEYYDLQQADEQVRINDSAVKNAQASLRDAVNLEKAGVGTRFDVLRSQVNLANSQQDLTNAISQQQIARRRLAVRLSLPQSVNISAADPVQVAGLWDKNLEESIILAYQNRPELQQQLAQRNINEQQRRQALASLGPQVSLVASYNLLDVFNDQTNVSDGYSLGVQASLNLFDGGAAKARAAQAKTNIRIAETQFAEQRNQIRFQVEQAFSTRLSNLENVQTAQAALEQAKEALRLARLRFQAGVGTQTDVINAENDLTRSEGNRIRAILDYNRALAELQRFVTSRAVNK